MNADKDKLSSNPLFDLIAIPPKEDGSDEWDDGHRMAYKVLTEENLHDVGVCMEEARRYPNLGLTFVVQSKEMADRVRRLIGYGEGRDWDILVMNVD